MKSIGQLPAGMKQQISVPENLVACKIYNIRERRVILDRDLAELYEVETKVLNQSVRRNIERFPDAFMFQLTSSEFENFHTPL